MLAPTVGTKLVLGTSDLKPFVRVSGSMPFLLSANVEVTDEDDQEYIDSLITDFKQDLKPIFLFTFGAGVEYFFAEQFSIGGEFNYRLLTGGWEYDYYDEWENEYYDPIEDTTYYFQNWRREEYNVGGNIGGTCAGLWLNYYF